mgnify:CR=1 FL=1
MEITLFTKCLFEFIGTLVLVLPVSYTHLTLPTN